MTKVLLLGDRPLARAALEALLEREADLHIVTSRGEAPDVVVLEHDGQDDAELGPALARLGPLPGNVVVVTFGHRVAGLAQLFRLGARGVVFMHQPASTLARAIREVEAGQIWLDRTASSQLITDLVETESSRAKELGIRDRRIVDLVARGLKNAQIAEALHVSEGTIRNRLTAIFKKVGVTGRMHLVSEAFRLGLVDRPDRPTAAAPDGGIPLA